MPQKLKQPRPLRSLLDKAKAYEVVWQQVAPVFEVVAALKWHHARFVYCIAEVGAGPLKIGSSKDPIARLRTMQTGNSRRLRIERLLIGNAETEKMLHEFYEPWAVIGGSHVKGKIGGAPRTEWFEDGVRESLYPILETAAFCQVDALSVMTTQLFYEDLEQIVREAHKEHDFVVRARDVARIPASRAGYLPTRPSRL